jgi:UDP-N-acetylglucosamine 2-epimerase
MTRRHNPYGDGRAAGRIAESIVEWGKHAGD